MTTPRRYTDVASPAVIAVLSLSTTWVACAGVKTQHMPPPPQLNIDAATLNALRIYHAPVDLQGGKDLVFKVCLTADGAIERVEYSANLQQEAALHIAEKITQAWSYQAYVPSGAAKGVAVCGLIASEELAALDAPKPPTVQVPPPKEDTGDVAAVASPNPVTPATSDAPTFIAPTSIEQLRLAGVKAIIPDHATATHMQRMKVSTVRVGVKLCLAADGTIASTNMLTSSGFGDFDRKIFNTIRATWKYRPFTRNGVGMPVCTTVTFIYSQ